MVLATCAVDAPAAAFTIPGVQNAVVLPTDPDSGMFKMVFNELLTSSKLLAITVPVMNDAVTDVLIALTDPLSVPVTDPVIPLPTTNRDPVILIEPVVVNVPVTYDAVYAVVANDAVVAFEMEPRTFCASIA